MYGQPGWTSLPGLFVLPPLSLGRPPRAAGRATSIILPSRCSIPISVKIQPPPPLHCGLRKVHIRITAAVGYDGQTDGRTFHVNSAC
ncbi:hypothetical protein BKA83DRAFT_1766073 [Pisolithus microcarpus]|nr:hypothetical protein BKA83DRAFT_1766073 [Pisolithus microcarpus]